MTKEEVIAAVQECAAKLGHAPSAGRVSKDDNQISKSQIGRRFGTFTQLLTASGLEVQGPGHMVEMKDTVYGLGGDRRGGEKKVPRLRITNCTASTA